LEASFGLLHTRRVLFYMYEP